MSTSEMSVYLAGVCKEGYYMGMICCGNWDSTYRWSFVCLMYMKDDTGVQIQRDGRKMGRVSSC